MRRGASILLAGVIAEGTSAAPPSARRLDQIGDARALRNALEFVGRINQSGPMFEAFGYLTHISGLPAASLFSHPAPRDETTARFTFYARTRLISRAVVANIFNVTSGGRARFYLDRSPDGDFDRPASFRDGTRIAAGRIRFQKS